MLMKEYPKVHCSIRWITTTPSTQINQRSIHIIKLLKVGNVPLIQCLGGWKWKAVLSSLPIEMGAGIESCSGYDL